jgi:uncharacterized membrane protein HdeD (DUF308 family)
MSDTRLSTSSKGLGYIQVASKWGWFIALGIVMIAAGIFALGDVVAFTLVSAIFIGAMMLVGGVFQIVQAFMTKAWSAFLLNVFVGILYVVGGFLIMQEPVQGSLILTLFLLAAILVGGITRIMIGLRHRELSGWWLMLLGGYQCHPRHHAICDPALVRVMGARHYRVAGSRLHVATVWFLTTEVGTLGEVMTHRPDVVGLPIDDGIASVLQTS